MSRRASAPRREILPDPRYHSELLAKFMNMIMEDGKKSKAEMIVYGALSQISTKKGTDEPLEVLEEALDNIRPAVEVKSLVWVVPPTRCPSKCAPCVVRHWPCAG